MPAGGSGVGTKADPETLLLCNSGESIGDPHGNAGGVILLGRVVLRTGAAWIVGWVDANSRSRSSYSVARNGEKDGGLQM